MKQALCVSSEIQRVGRRNTPFTAPAQDCQPYHPMKETAMKAYRLITLAAALLINVLVARVLIEDKIEVSPDEAHAMAAEAP
jgi:hypothetical protein